MSEPFATMDDNERWIERPEVTPVRKGQAWLAWLVILVMVVLVVAAPHLRPLVKAASASDAVHLVVFQLQVRMLLGAAPFMNSDQDRDQLYQQISTLNQGTVGQRLSFAIAAGELKGPGEALHHIEETRRKLERHGIQPTEVQNRQMATLERLYAAYDAGQWRPFAPDSEEAKFLQQQFGWFGKLALSPGQAPPDKGTILPRAEVDRDNQRTFLAMMGAVVVGLGMLALGFCALVVLTILAAMGTIKSNVQCGSYHHAVYAETFALWMVLFVALQIVTGLTAPRGWQLGAAGLGALISLIVLAWPVLRGLPWRTVRADIGLTSGRAPLLEPLFGFGSYLASLPILAVSLLLVLFLLAIVGGLQTLLPDNGNPFEPTGGPTHPIIESFVRPSWSGLLQIFFAASIAAPIVEEIMFRGFLYRHLRETTRGLGTALSFIASALVGSFIFAVIHPQGIVLVPALMALAFGFTIAREWRGTVYPGMIAHGVHNGLLMTFVLVALS